MLREGLCKPVALSQGGAHRRKIALRRRGIGAGAGGLRDRRDVNGNGAAAEELGPLKAGIVGNHPEVIPENFRVAGTAPGVLFVELLDCDGLTQGVDRRGGGLREVGIQLELAPVAAEPFT